MFLFILGGKYIEIRTYQEEYSSGFITTMNKFHTVVSQHSKRGLQFPDSMFTREYPRKSHIIIKFRRKIPRKFDFARLIMHGF
jgi:hypothetical protein